MALVTDRDAVGCCFVLWANHVHSQNPAASQTMTAGSPISGESMRSGDFTYGDVLTTSSSTLHYSQDAAAATHDKHPTQKPVSAYTTPPTPLPVAVAVLSPSPARTERMESPLDPSYSLAAAPAQLDGMVVATLERHQQHLHLLQQQQQLLSEWLRQNPCQGAHVEMGTSHVAASHVVASQKLVAPKKRSSPQKASSLSKISAKLLSEYPADKDYLRPQGWPPGWITKEFERTSGASKGTKDRYWYSPIRHYKLRSLVQVRKFLDLLEIHGGDEKVAVQILSGQGKGTVTSTVSRVAAAVSPKVQVPKKRSLPPKVPKKASSRSSKKNGAVLSKTASASLSKKVECVLPSKPAKPDSAVSKLLCEHAAEKDYLRPQGWPAGWITKVFERQSGATKGTTDRYWYSPICEYKLRSLTQVRKFLDLLEINGGDESVAIEILRRSGGM
jgi:Methyl-CpG binding domain